ncbi:TssN family type VI secretion system protein [Tenacibaculum maritimum]|uniref:TssN family type VI secretion system protein n=1 Tax=Tenacibaculum maritimum TaxID=107401 RepID=UPI0012E638A0|nr:TssN family type VI secretion system protein [Tenacibaculum maritimum]CAA0182581.1 conserved membrane hypothetical protein [Tenacibaculum maritimum]
MEALIAFFLRYLLAPILVVILLVVIGNLMKMRTKTLKMKKVVVFVLVLSLILSLPSLLGFLKNEFVWGGLALTIIAYLLLGVGFVLIRNLSFYKNIKGEEEKEGKVDFNKITELLIMLVAVILSTWIYYLIFSWISKLPYAIWAMFSTVWFFMPFLYVLSKELFLKIETPFYKAWKVELNNDHRDYWEHIDTFRLIQVTVKIKRRSEDEEYSSFSVKLPREVPLGVWFNKFIEDQNVRFPENMIDPFGGGGTEIGWIFYTSKWFSFPLFIKVLDSKEDGKFNRVKNKQVIYIRRTKVKSEE